MLEITNPQTGKQIEVALNDFDGKIDWYKVQEAIDQLGSGWRLPTKVELEQIHKDLHLKGHGGFKLDPYWSHSDPNEENVWLFMFGDGSSYSVHYERGEGLVRAVRTI